MGIKNAWYGLIGKEIDSEPERDSDILDDSKESDYEYANQWYRQYKQNGFMKKIVNAPADDATREWFDLEIEKDNDNKLADIIQNRLKELDVKHKLREMIKYSRIYEEGSGLFFGIDAGKNLVDTLTFKKPIPEQIKKLDYINVLDNPDNFDIRVVNRSDLTKQNYGDIKLTINMQEIHSSRGITLINEYNPETGKGISVVDTVKKGIEAQDSALSGTMHILERLGAILFKSESTKLEKNYAETIYKLMNMIKKNLKSNGAMGIHPNDSIEMMSYSFSGMKDAYEFVLDNLSGLSDIPKPILIGGLKGGIITGEGHKGELINYYRTIEGFQENTLKPIIRKIIDLILREKDISIQNRKNLKYDIKFNPLWSLTEKEESEVGKIKSERDRIDYQTGKATGDELRQLDHRLSQLDK